MNTAIMRSAMKVLLGSMLAAGSMAVMAQQPAASGHVPAAGLSQKWGFVDK